MVGARLVATKPAGYAAFKLGGGPWYGYWYGVILEVVDGTSEGLDEERLSKVALSGTAKQK